MPFRDWLPHPPIGVGIVLVILMTATSLFRHEMNSRHAYELARQAYEESKRVVNADAAAHRPYAGEKSYREEWRAEQDLDAQRRMAEAAELGLLVLVATLLSTGVAAVATWRTVAILRTEFAVTHRPKIVVHKFEWTSNGSRHVGAAFTCVNAGVTRARIVEIGSRIFRGSACRDVDVESFTSKWLAPGERETFSIDSTLSDFEAIVGHKRSERGFSSDDTMCAGYIRYTDGTGAMRETGFCRSLDAGRHTWERIEHPDYEYDY